MGLKANLPYPSLDGICEDCRALRTVSPAYAGREGELTATLQYVYQSILLSECGKEELSKLLMSIAVTEMHHIEILGALITRLGAPPVFTACPPYPRGILFRFLRKLRKNSGGMLYSDICGEREAIAEYEKMLCNLSNEKVRAVIERIVEDERVHLAALRNAYDDLRCE